jgi:hypothetical protein
MASGTPFPSIDLAAIDAWRWPTPPFAWRHQAAVGDGAQRCRIETRNGAAVEGDLLTIDPSARSLGFRTAADGAAVQLPFARFSRLTLLEPLVPAPRRAGMPVERVPAAAQERSYCLHLAQTGALLEGRTLGYVETDDALYLYPPADGDRSVLRVLVPRSAYVRAEFGASAEETAARDWVATPDALLAALAVQATKPVRPIGQSLLALGLVTPAQLQQALDTPDGVRPIGQRLVAAGVLSQAALHTAVAHKMGYPFVDLDRFPIDPQAVVKLPYKIAVKARVLPLMVDGTRLIVAVDRPARIDKLQELRGHAPLQFVPVLASKQRILAVLSRYAKGDPWSANELRDGSTEFHTLT